MKRLLALLGSCLFGGCSSLVVYPYQQPSLATPYQAETSFTLRGGYSEKKLSEDRYSVTFNGNGEVPHKAAEDFALMRGAQLCQAAGFDYFKMLSGTIYTDRVVMNGVPSTSPRAVAEIQCSHEAAGNGQSVSEFIARTEASYPLMYHPNRHPKT